jgi:methylphosphotriester-DNA--protein-cysteine methyltransferase
MPGQARVQELEAFVGQWRFASAPPDPDLAGIVVEYWEVEGRLAPFREKVLPNGCVEVMIDLGPPHQMIADGETTLWDRSWFSGLHERSIEIQSENGTHLVSARLTPLGAFKLFGDDAPGAANTVIDLETFAGSRAGELRSELLGVARPAERFAILETFLRARVGTASASSFVTGAVERIDREHGRVKVSELHEELGISRKHLTLTFTREVGVPPKAYAQIRRFVWTLSRLRESETVDWAALSAEAGYSDQSHLVRDFRRVASASPTEFLRRRSPDNTALLEEAR